MKKFLLIVVLLLVIVIGGGGFYVYQNGTKLMRQAVLDYGPEVTGTSVGLSDVSLMPFNGQAGIAGLKVGTPTGYSAPYTFKVDKIDIKIKPATLIDDVLVIENIDIIAPSVVFEPKGKASNLTEVQKNVERYTAASDPNAEPVGPEKVIVQRLAIRQPEVVVFAKGLIGEQSVTADDIVLTGIGADTGGVPPEEVATAIMAELQPVIMSSLRSKAGAALLKGVVDGKLDDIIPSGKVKDALKGDVGSKVKGLLGGLGKKD
ncbi:MAG: hypothetical protein AAF221_06685 [Pseudomonadota bacterium]